ncbi:MAG: hypothetical protein F6K03_07065 [Kamptonema sp. SIO4C4]|nr:hypothetical protein [Kamptonema sp. SIO4C4]
MQVNRFRRGGVGLAIALTILLPACQGKQSPPTPQSSDPQTAVESPDIQTFTGVVQETYDTGLESQITVQVKNSAGEVQDFTLFHASPTEFPQGKQMTFTYTIERNPKVIAIRRLDETPKDRQNIREQYPDLPVAIVQGKYLEGTPRDMGTYIRLQEETGEDNTWLAGFNPDFANNQKYKGQQVALSYVKPKKAVVIDYEVAE